MKSHINGPKFVRWVEALAPETIEQHRDMKNSSLARALNRWKEDGAQASIASADRHLTTLDIPLSWVPDDFYEDYYCRRPPENYSEAFRRQAVDRVERGEKITLVAKEIGCTSKSIYNWRKAAA